MWFHVLLIDRKITYPTQSKLQSQRAESVCAFDTDYVHQVTGNRLILGPRFCGMMSTIPSSFMMSFGLAALMVQIPLRVRSVADNSAVRVVCSTKIILLDKSCVPTQTTKKNRDGPKIYRKHQPQPACLCLSSLKRATTDRRAVSW